MLLGHISGYHHRQVILESVWSEKSISPTISNGSGDFDVLVTPILIIIQLPNFNQNPASKSDPKFSLKSWPEVKGLKQWQRQECSARASYKTNFWTCCVWSYRCVCMNDHLTQHSQQISTSVCCAVFAGFQFSVCVHCQMWNQWLFQPPTIQSRS